MDSGNESRTVVITGAFSYTGKYATRLLLQRGYKVRTLTAHPHRQNEFGPAVEALPLNFDRQAELERSLRGASSLINTYWIRFPKNGATFESAIKNTLALFNAAKNVGVKRIVHVSIANPSIDSKLGYYRGKAILENALAELRVPYSIVRPTVIFGREDILINNMAWFLRKFPVFAIPGDGKYRVRPIFVEDMATLLADAVERQGNAVIDAAGPETFTFEELVRRIAESLGNSPIVIQVPTSIAHAATRMVGWIVGDVVLTKQEYTGLMNGLLAPVGPSTGKTCLSNWLKLNHRELGATYASEVARHFAGGSQTEAGR
jgi:uncharacterized protein YbjT (DUF2867 family)